MKDYYDISTWKNKPIKYLDYFSNQKKSNLKLKSISPLEVDVTKLYALLKCKIASQPNGIYTYFIEGLPLDNMIWWDFALESDKGFIHIWRTSHIVEANYYVEEIDFDLKKFIYSNISKYVNEVQKTIESFEKHTLYINHFESYKNCVEYLWTEISKLNLHPPKSPQKHVIEKEELEKYTSNIEQFAAQSIKFHTLGKSLILNAAFKIESFLNLVIRVGATNELKNYPDVLKKHLNSTFSDRLRSLKFYSIIMRTDIDLENQAIKDAFELMTLRNKYVHFDESSVHNKLGETYFDGNFPLQQTAGNAPAIDFYIQAFHNPDYKIVKKSYNASCQFVDYLQSLFISEYKDDIMHLFGQNPIGYNETKKMYSSVNTPNSIDFYMTLKDK